MQTQLNDLCHIDCFNSSYWSLQDDRFSLRFDLSKQSSIFSPPFLEKSPSIFSSFLVKPGFNKTTIRSHAVSTLDFERKSNRKVEFRKSDPKVKLDAERITEKIVELVGLLRKPSELLHDFQEMKSTGKLICMPRAVSCDIQKECPAKIGKTKIRESRKPLKPIFSVIQTRQEFTSRFCRRSVLQNQSYHTRTDSLR